MQVLKDLIARAGGTSQVTLGSNGGNAAILFGSSSDAIIQRTGAGVLALSSTHKLQQGTAPSTGDDLANQTYADRLAMFYS